MSTDLVSPFAGWTAPAGETDLTQFTFVAFNASGQLVKPTQGQKAVVLYDAPSIAAATYNANTEQYTGGYVVGEHYTFVAKDFPKVKFNATIAAGAPVMTDTNGYAIAATASNTILGYAMEAHVAGDLGSIEYAPSIHP